MLPMTAAQAGAEAEAEGAKTATAVALLSIAPMWLLPPNTWL